MRASKHVICIIATINNINTDLHPIEIYECELSTNSSLTKKRERYTSEMKVIRNMEFTVRHDG